MPEYNDNQIEKIAEFLKDVRCVSAVKLLAYHKVDSKYEAIGYKSVLPKNAPTSVQMKEKAESLRKAGLNVKF